ncbi:MAG: mechanosensitive ion channel [Candidatus Omnitrophota bacterium]|nr:mechanosensitive ion channel [Candidatus Omnitrophota bacterium]
MSNYVCKAKKLFFIVVSGTFPVLAWAQEKTPQEGIFVSEISAARKLLDLLVEFCVKYSFQALGGIIVVILGWVAAKFIARFFEALFLKKNVDVTVIKFLVSIIKIIIVAFAMLIALGKFGITIAPFIAGISVIGFGASFAVQGPLSNYAAGTTLIFTKPFKVGDIVEVSDVTGEVTDMTLARTEMKTLDGTVIFIPNKQIIGEVIHNYSAFKKLDITVGISYESDVDKAIKIIKEIIASENRLTKQPEPKIGISEFADSSINIYARLWCKQNDYYDLLFSINRDILGEFNKNYIVIPFPQRDVHIYEEKKNT